MSCACPASLCCGLLLAPGPFPLLHQLSSMPTPLCCEFQGPAFGLPASPSLKGSRAGSESCYFRCSCHSRGHTGLCSAIADLLPPLRGGRWGGAGQERSGTEALLLSDAAPWSVLGARLPQAGALGPCRACPREVGGWPWLAHHCLKDHLHHS